MTAVSVAIRRQFPTLGLDIAFEAPSGVTALFGPSGCGKTSTINAVAGLMTPESGRIAVNERVLFDSTAGVNLPVKDRRIGYVFQDARLFPHLTVASNLRYSWRFRRGARADFDRIVEMLALGPLLKRRPRNLSGGEKQRTAIGRALLSGPELLVMDEPLAALDEARKAEIMPWLERLRDEVNLPILYVSHSTAEVVRLATTLVMMQQGRVIYSGPVAEALSDAATGPAFGLREAGALLPGRIERIEPDSMCRVATPAGALLLPAQNEPEGAEIRLRILAHEVILSLTPPEGLSALNVLPARVEKVSGGFVELAVGESRLLAQITERSVAALGLAPGIPCHAIIKSAAMVRS
ncbi:molybdenum ABC transporter ATP-binding protein [Paracoccus aminophilus]|uniref:Molybdate transporter ModC, ATP-binding protein n=1 Tax=Paracoccus aminophilus JCM 7686 TaxID=1367847 RepID=S5XQS7_PARAH|nr:molybdenum ABC transporter ATP-binding protein [Paracoccus aminophilus]AGT07422.1 molybdate transporter ModC, ATP-binding protein [Paracoccus aminophilus JCM 7686]